MERKGAQSDDGIQRSLFCLEVVETWVGPVREGKAGDGNETPEKVTWSLRPRVDISPIVSRGSGETGYFTACV